VNLTPIFSMTVAVIVYIVHRFEPNLVSGLVGL